MHYCHPAREQAVAMFASLGLVWIAITTGFASASGQEGQREKPVVHATAVTEPIDIGTLQEAYEHSAMVVVARVERQRSAKTPLSTPVMSDYDCAVSEVIKGRAELRGKKIVVRRAGGIRDEGKVIVKSVVQGFPDFQPGAEYVMFLGWARLAKVYLASSEGTYRLEGSKVIPFGKFDEPERHRGQPIDEFLGELRSLKPRAPVSPRARPVRDRRYSGSPSE